MLLCATGVSEYKLGIWECSGTAGLVFHGIGPVSFLDLLDRGQDHRSGLARSDDHQGPNLLLGSPMVEEAECGDAPNLLSTPHRDYERWVREQRTQMFAASGFDAKAGHCGHRAQSLETCLLQPAAGVSLPRGWTTANNCDILRRAPLACIALADTDLSGDPGHTTAIEEGTARGRSATTSKIPLKSSTA